MVVPCTSFKEGQVTFFTSDLTSLKNVLILVSNVASLREGKQARRGLNPQPSVLETDALPLSHWPAYFVTSSLYGVFVYRI